MKRAVLDQILRSVDPSAAQGEKITLAEGLRVDVLVSAGADTIPVSGIRELVLGELFLTASTDKEETYYLEYEHVLAVRTKGKLSSHRIGRAGFASS